MSDNNYETLRRSIGEVEQFIRDGIMVVRGAVEASVLRRERLRQSSSLEKLRDVHHAHWLRAFDAQTIIPVEHGGKTLKVDAASVVVPGDDISDDLSRDVFALLRCLKSAIADAGFVIGDDESRPSGLTSSFTNYYVRELDGMLVPPHVDHSLMTALSTAVDLKNLDEKPLPGFEYELAVGTFMPLCPEAHEDLIVMLGREASALHRNGVVLRGLCHRVTNDSEVVRRNRSTMVFKIH